MLDQASDLDAQIAALKHVTQALWVNMIRLTGGADPAAVARRVAEESLQSLETAYGLLPASEDQHMVIQAILHHEEVFWKGVADALRQERFP